jgi:hypothetical protein
VEAMALPHSEGTVEIACNLLDISITPQEGVLAFVERMSQEAGIKVLGGYTTNKSPDELMQIALEQLSAQ